MSQVSSPNKQYPHLFWTTFNKSTLMNCLIQYSFLNKMKSDLVNNMEFHYYSATYHLLSHQYSVHSVLLTDLKLQKFCYIYDFQCNFMKILTINSDWFISIYVSYFDVEITWINKQFKQKDIKPNQINYFTKYQNMSTGHWCLMLQDTCNNTHT